MKIIIEDYPSGYPQEIKWSAVDRGFEYLNSKQIKKNCVEMVFIKNEGFASTSR